ncbi:Uma2 family endonuclease [Bergeyella sp. RCAD1439]|uniref:Uma2 family endonuclease n=1 Tax=Bergeyella anatis TaxID=3113737 RepID=UPI002E172AD8|nr:Uma2 family endonuclease [Bergeyella sp. RCAD1439]
MAITDINQLDLNKTYSYADYLLWQVKEKIELFKGKILAMSPAPARYHQKIVGNIHGILFPIFKGKKCELYTAPFDVRIPKQDKEDDKIFTVVQPDLSVICDPEKLDERGCIGAPDLVIEILSPGNSKKEMDVKFTLYEEAGVLEYWIVHPTEKVVWIYVLENGRYVTHKPFVEGEFLVSKKFPDLKINTAEIFE